MARANIRIEKNEKRVDVIGEFYDNPPVFAVQNVYGIRGTRDKYLITSNPSNRQMILDDKDCIAWFVTTVNIDDELSLDFDGDYAYIAQEDFLEDIFEQKQRLAKFHTNLFGDVNHTTFCRTTFAKTFSDFIMRSDAVYDYVEEVLDGNGFVGDFHIWRNPEEEVFFCHMPSGTIVSWYKWNHVGRSNWMNRSNASTLDLEAFFKMLRLDVIDEIKDKPEYFEKPDMFRQHKKMTEEEIRKAMDKLNRNTVYGGLVNPDKEVRRIDKALANGISPLDPASLYPASTDDTDKLKTMYKFAAMALEKVCSYFNKLDSNILIKRNDDDVFLRVYKVDGHRIDIRKEGVFINVDDVNTGEFLIFDEFSARYVNPSESLKIKFSDFVLGKSDLDKIKTIQITSNVLKDFLLNIYDALY